MQNNVMDQVKVVIAQSVGGNLGSDKMSDDLKLVGNILDSLAVTKLIAGLEEHFGIAFEDTDLSAEAFETVASLAQLVQSKLG